MADEKFLYPSDSEAFEMVRDELQRARAEFPEHRNQLAALQEEVGELSKALLEHDFGDATKNDVLREAIQAAAMAIRVATEGDTSFEYDNPDDTHPSFGETLDGDPKQKKRALRCLEVMERRLKEAHNRKALRYRIRLKARPDGRDVVKLEEDHLHRDPCPIGSGSSIFLALSGSHTHFRTKGYLEEAS